MKINLPIVKKTFNEETGKVEKQELELSVQVDTSFLAHLKWEEHFQKVAGYDLAVYTEIVQKQLKNDQSKVSLLGLLKLLFCYISGEAIPTFRDFVAMFDVDNTEAILSKVRVVLEQVGNTVSKN